MTYDATLSHPNDITKSEHNVSWNLCHPDEKAPERISSRWLMTNAGCHLDDLQCCPMSSKWDNYNLIPKSSGWHSHFQYLIQMTYRHCRMSSGWLTILPYLIRATQSHLNPKSSGWVSSWPYLIQMTYGRCIMSSGWLSWHWYLIWISYGNVIMSSRWYKLPFLSHLDELANFNLSQHAVDLQHFRTYYPWRPPRG